MSSTDYRGIDYSGRNGTCNRDATTGIRYGIISQNAILQAWSEESEPDYGEPTCGWCGNDAFDLDALANLLRKDGRSILDLSDEDYPEWVDEKREYHCAHCEKSFDSDEAYPDEPASYTYESEGIEAFSDSAGDVWVTKSPFYTRAQFCSPCAPGACHLESPCPTGERAYCFPPDWFDADIEPCPYPVYRVDTGELVYAPTE